MTQPTARRWLGVLVELRPGEALSVTLMFAYAYLVMLAYNIARPLTESEAINALGAVNIPYLDLGVGVLIGVLMLGYVRLYGALPRRWALSIILGGMSVVMVLFWGAFQTGQAWVPIAFYLWGSVLGILTISQFWTLANGLYEPRQGKRLFGFIGGGVTLGGATGSFTTAFLIETVGTDTLILCSGAALLVCTAVTAAIASREAGVADVGSGAEREKGVGVGRALELLRESKHVQVIAAVIALGAISARIIAQQLNMTAELLSDGAAIGSFLAFVRGYMSLAAFVLQVWVTPRIHRYLGVGFALLMLPAGLTFMAAGILMTQILQAPAVVNVFDRSIRYTVDKTTREVLFLPLPGELRQDVKPFVDVTVDRVSKGVAAILMLVLIQPWGFELEWWQLSFVSLGLMAVWFVVSRQAKRGYRTALRESLDRHDVEPAEMRLDVADLATVETLMAELASPDPDRVLYAIDILESLDKRNLVTPLLLHHESPAVRARVLQAMGDVPADVAAQWLPSIERLAGDSHPDVRAAAVSALANIRQTGVTDLVRPYLEDRDPRMAVTAAVVLARHGHEAEVTEAERVLTRLAEDRGDGGAETRREVAVALGQLPDERFRRILVSLLHDPDPSVSGDAMRSVRTVGTADLLFVPALVSLLRHRQLKSAAREALVGYGEDVLDTLGYVLRDPDENIWVRRHLPATLARIPSQKSVDVLVEALEEKDGFLRYKAIVGLTRLHREHPELTVRREPVEKLAVRETLRYFDHLTLHYNLFTLGQVSSDVLLERALREKMTRGVDRVYLLLGLLYPWQDVSAARRAIEHGDVRARASAVEFFDNTLDGVIHKRVLPLIDDAPLEERVRRANVVLKTRPRDVEETLLRLINDDDQVIACAAIDLVEGLKVWTLVDDLEHVLAHRTVRDVAVFEAASWALAAYRMPRDERRSKWLEPLPAVQLAARLRQVPMFARVSVDELFRIAATGRQTRHERGHVLCEAGGVPAHLHFLLDGSASSATASSGEETSSGAGTTSPSIAPPAAIGIHEILEGRSMRDGVRATGTCVCLALSGDEIRTLITDNPRLVEGLFGTLVEDAAAMTPCVVRGAAVRPSEPARAGELRAVDKILALQAVPGMAGVGAAELRHVATIARDVPLTPEATLFSAGDPPALWAVLSGRVTLSSPNGEPPLTAEPGDSVGVYETLAGVSLGRDAVVSEAGRALRIDHDDLFDLLGQRPALLQQLFATLLKRQSGP